MLRIYLVRHGQNEDNENSLLNGHRDKPLTKIGVEQATTLAKTIKDSGIHFEKIYASPLQRAYKTASIIAEKLTMDQPEKIEDLIERDFGELTGKKISEAVAISRPNTLSTDIVEYILYPKDGETFPMLLKRGEKVLQSIQDKHTDGNILLVAHGDIGKMIYAAYYKIDWENALQLFHFGNTEVLLLAPNISLADTHVFKSTQHNS